MRDLHGCLENSDLENSDLENSDLRPSGCLENSDPKDKTNLDRISRSSVRSYNFQGTSSISFLRPVQTLATLLANKTQQCWAQHVASVCTPCCVLLRLVGSCWMKFETGQTSSINFQQVATTYNMVCKRSQHVGPNIVASCWPTMLRAFARAFTHSWILLNSNKNFWHQIFETGRNVKRWTECFYTSVWKKYGTYHKTSSMTSRRAAIDRSLRALPHNK